MKNVSVKFGLATAIISVVIFRILPTAGIVRRKPKILSQLHLNSEIKFQSIKGQTINHKIELTHCRYLSQPMHARTQTHFVTYPNGNKQFQPCAAQTLQIVRDLVGPVRLAEIFWE